MNPDFNKIKQILSEYPVEVAYLYGSFAQGTPRSWSDLDIALIVAENVDEKKYPDLENEISLKIDRSAEGIESDVRIMNHAPLNYKIQAVQYGKIIYSKNEIIRVNFETSVRALYFDFLPKREEYRKNFFEETAKGGLLWSTPKK